MICRGADHLQALCDSVLVQSRSLYVSEMSYIPSCPLVLKKKKYREKNDKDIVTEASALKELNNRLTLKRMKEALSDCYFLQ